MSGPERPGAGGGLLGAYRVPAGPVEQPPGGAPIPPRIGRLLLAEVLDGIALGAWDARLLDGLAAGDPAVLRTVLGLLVRARAAGPLGP